jgi:hypothetical protein
MFTVLSVESGLPVSETVFPDAKTAQAFANEHKTKTGERCRLSRIVTEAWRQREALRLQDGTYAPLPAWWQAATWWQGSEASRDHYAHMAKDGTRIAFTESAAKGEADSQLVLSGTKYLARYFSEVLTSHAIAQIGMQIGADKYAVQFSAEADDFVKVYTQGGISSCMAHDADSYDSECHPVEVYAAGDLQIAWMEAPKESEGEDGAEDEDFKIVARAIVWPAKKTYTRIYYQFEDMRAKMVKALEDEGYTRNEHGFTGARLLRIETGEGFVAPYIDCQHNVTDRGRYLVINPDGELCCDNTNGIVETGSRYSCERCGDGIDEDDTRSVQDQTWCEYCANNYAFYCARSGETYPDTENSVEVITRHGNSETWHIDAANEDAFYCERSDAHYHDRYYTSVEVYLSANNSETWCAEENEGEYFHCDNTDKDYSRDAFTSIEVYINSSETETWCVEENEGEYFTCAVCGLVHAEDMRDEGDLFETDICADCARKVEAGIAPIPVSSMIEDARQIELAV